MLCYNFNSVINPSSAEYSRKIKSIPRPLMHWFLEKQGDWLWRMHKSFTTKDFDHLCHLNIKVYQKMQINLFPKKTIQHVEG